MHEETDSFNYRYLLSKAAGRTGTGAVLDYGCGRGQIVALGLDQGLDIWGVDSYTGVYSFFADSTLPAARARLARLEGDIAPFPDEKFELILSNMVFEHVLDIQATFKEIYRLLKPGGTLIAAFPVRETWYEGHTGIYFGHQLAKGPLRRAYFTAYYALGFGLLGEVEPVRQRVELAENSIDATCYYRPRREILGVLEAVFGSHCADLASDYMRARFAARLSKLPRAFDPVLGWVCHRRVGQVLSIAKQ